MWLGPVDAALFLILPSLFARHAVSWGTTKAWRTRCPLHGLLPGYGIFTLYPTLQGRLLLRSLPVWGRPHSLAIPKTRVAGWNRDGRALVAISYIVDDRKEQRRWRIGQRNMEVDLGQAIQRYAACLRQTRNQRTRCIVVNVQNLRVARGATCVLE
jgi:hypothetical protein